MAVELQRSVVIHQSAQRIHQVLDNVADYPNWAVGLDEVDVVEADEAGNVTKAHVTVNSPLGPLRATMRFERDDRGIISQLEQGDMLAAFDARYMLTSTHAGTQVDATLKLASSSTLVPESLLEAYADRVVTGWLDGLKATCETSDPGLHRGA